MVFKGDCSDKTIEILTEDTGLQTFVGHLRVQIEMDICILAHWYGIYVVCRKSWVNKILLGESRLCCNQFMSLIDQQLFLFICSH